jgi:hypothetical protein
MELTGWLTVPALWIHKSPALEPDQSSSYPSILFQWHTLILPFHPFLGLPRSLFVLQYAYKCNDVYWGLFSRGIIFSTILISHWLWGRRWIKARQGKLAPTCTACIQIWHSIMTSKVYLGIHHPLLTLNAIISPISLPVLISLVGQGQFSFLCSTICGGTRSWNCSNGYDLYHTTAFKSTVFFAFSLLSTFPYYYSWWRWYLPAPPCPT